jgi:hypothetical protein
LLMVVSTDHGSRIAQSAAVVIVWLPRAWSARTTRVLLRAVFGDAYTMACWIGQSRFPAARTRLGTAHRLSHHSTAPTNQIDRRLFCSISTVLTIPFMQHHVNQQHCVAKLSGYRPFRDDVSCDFARWHYCARVMDSEENTKLPGSRVKQGERVPHDL